MQYIKMAFLLLTGLLSISVRAQPEQSGPGDPVFLAESLLIHTDRQLYISGEVIWFKILAFEAGTDQLSNFSQVAYLELMSPQGVAVSRVKINLHEGQGSGSTDLPSALNSGNYTLLAYTQAMRSLGADKFARSKLILLNPDQPVVEADPAEPGFEKFLPDQGAMTISPDRAMHIQMDAVQASIGQRREATLEITTTNADGHPVAADLSLSVALKPSDDTPTKPLFQSGMPTNNQPIPAVTEVLYPVENRGLRLNGRVTDEATQSGAAAVKVFLAFPGEVALVYLATTQADGAFSFLLPKLYGLRQLVLQTDPEDTRNLRLELDNEFHPVPAEDPGAFVLPPAWVPMANAALVNAQIQQSYRSFELPPRYKINNPFDSIPFFGSPDARYRLDDYNRFPLPEFFFEIVTEVIVKGKYGSERVEVLNEWENPLEAQEPLLLVDGIPVFDQRTFLKINNKLIESAEVVTEPFWLNPLFYNGVIHLISFDQDGRCFRLPENALQRSFLTLLPERRFSIPDYEAQTDSRLPDFRNTLYWDPAIRTDKNGKATVKFYTGDAVGNFEIHAAGVSGIGALGSATGSMEVVKEVR